MQDLKQQIKDLLAECDDADKLIMEEKTQMDRDISTAMAYGELRRRLSCLIEPDAKILNS